MRFINAINRKEIATLALIIPTTIVLALALTGCGALLSLSAETSNQDTMSNTEEPTILNRGVVLDSTSSTDPQFSADVRDCLVSELNGLDPQDEDLNDGAESIPATNLWIFIVGNNPTASYSSANIFISLPSVTALAPRPQLNDDNALDAVQHWNKDKSRYQAEYQKWLDAKNNAVEQLKKLDISTKQHSGIFSTVSALAAVVPPGTSILLASDLENNRDPQTTGSLKGSKVYALQPTPSGDMASADSLYENCVQFLVSLGVNSQDIVRYRSEQTQQAVHDFMVGS